MLIIDVGHLQVSADRVFALLCVEGFSFVSYQMSDPASLKV